MEKRKHRMNCKNIMVTFMNQSFCLNYPILHRGYLNSVNSLTFQQNLLQVFQLIAEHMLFIVSTKNRIVESVFIFENSMKVWYMSFLWYMSLSQNLQIIDEYHSDVINDFIMV